MYIVPSIYIRDNKTVALAEGGNIYDADPLLLARYLTSVGTEVLFIMDLNIPATGHSPHTDLIAQIIEETGLKVQLAGNIRSADIVDKFLSIGVERVTLGTIAYQKPDFLKRVCEQFPGKIAAHIDVRSKKVVIKGYAVAAHKTAIDYAEQFDDAGVGTIIYSDVTEEGTITLADIKSVSDFIRHSPLPIFHSTDISRSGDLDMILNMKSPRIIGTIFGKSMYSGIIDIASAITHVKEETPDGMDEPTLIP